MTRLTRSLYRSLLRVPPFKGKARLEGWMRKCFSERTSPIQHGLRMVLDPVEWTQVELLQHGTLHPEITALQEGLLQPGDTFVNIGAHVGFFTLHARTLVGAGGKVIAMDPQPYNCDRLLSNLRANHFENVTVYVAAAGDTESFILLPHQKYTDKARLSMADFRANDQPQRFVVPLLRLDRVLAAEKISHVKLLFVSVVGFELSVLRGLSEFSGRIDHMILGFENTDRPLSEDALSLVQLLHDRHYRLRALSGEEWAPGKVLQQGPKGRLWASLD